MMMSAMPQTSCFSGTVKVSSGFMKARTGRLSGVLRPTLRIVSSFVNTAESLVSLPAAASVSTEPTGMVFSSLARPLQKSQTSVPGLATPWAMALAESMTLPPPTARMKLALKASASRTPSRTSATRGFGWTPPSTWKASPADVSWHSMRESRPLLTTLPPP